jgi:hypothetical protein
LSCGSADPVAESDAEGGDLNGAPLMRGELVRERIKKEFRDLSVETTPLPTKRPAATRSKLKDQGPDAA